MTLLAQSDFGSRYPLREQGPEDPSALPGLGEAEALLLELASVFGNPGGDPPADPTAPGLPAEAQESNLEAKYRALLEQIPAVVFMAYIDRGVSEAYVSPEKIGRAHV